MVRASPEGGSERLTPVNHPGTLSWASERRSRIESRRRKEVKGEPMSVSKSISLPDELYVRVLRHLRNTGRADSRAFSELVQRALEEHIDEYEAAPVERSEKTRKER